MLNPRRVLSKGQILQNVWHYDFGGNANVVETYVSYLRKKLDSLGPPLIKTVRQAGYMLEAVAMSRAPGEMSRLSLRARLVLGVLLVAAVGLLVADAVTYAALRSFLLDRVDQTLDDDHRRAPRGTPAQSCLGRSTAGRASAGRPPADGPRRPAPASSSRSARPAARSSARCRREQFGEDAVGRRRTCPADDRRARPVEHARAGRPGASTSRCRRRAATSATASAPRRARAAAATLDRRARRSTTSTRRCTGCCRIEVLVTIARARRRSCCSGSGS